MAAQNNEWEGVQIKTFTKWCNNHLSKAYGGAQKIEDILVDWQNGILLSYLAAALYKENEKNPEQAIAVPKWTARELQAKQRIEMAANCNKSLALLKHAGVALRISAENLMDHDKVNILGMVWMIILDYAARGFGGTPAELKKALLEWVNKKCDGYERVNPPSVKNFSQDWRSGLAWCALIHRHRPELLDYQKCLYQSNAENLELAFTVAEQHLDIPRLLDVADVDVDKPDDKSVMTYVMEYFNAFAGEGLKEGAAKQTSEWLSFLREIRNRQDLYTKRARVLLQWAVATQQGWSGYNFGNSLEEANQAFDKLRNFLAKDKSPKEVEKMDLEALFAEIQTTLSVNGLAPFQPPADVTPENINNEFVKLATSQNSHGEAVRSNKFRFVEKKEDNSEEEKLAEIKQSFNNYDKNSNGVLNQVEFIAACMELGIVLKTQDEKEQFFNKISGGQPDVTFTQFKDWMLSRMVVKMDSAASVKAAFRTIADGREGLSDGNLGIGGFNDEDREFLRANLKKDANGLYDFGAFVDQVMK